MRQSKCYPVGFEEREDLRSEFIREITLRQISEHSGEQNEPRKGGGDIPRKLVRFWHDSAGPPQDVQACLDSWARLEKEGFALYMFDDVSAADYISRVFGQRERQAFSRCTHPAMRCDYFRLCFVLAEGGLYVDADDVLLGEGWRRLFEDSKLKLQPLAYDIAAASMMPAADIWNVNLSTVDRVFYVNNDPIAAPPNHPVVIRAFERATSRLLANDGPLEIQATTGPGNLTAALTAHAWMLQSQGTDVDFELLRDWEAIAELRWDLGYRRDSRNWRLVFGC
jgi:hypothetical protein